jgi:ubiquinone/menaquinone biosynthesis C-methylase UbiE
MSNQSRQIDTAPAEVYERYLVPAMFRPWAKDLIDLAAPQPGESVLDLACGTGIVARLAAERVTSSGYVAGLDIDPAMLAVAASRHPSIVWRESRAENIPFDDHSFDLVLCQQGLQFFPDRPAALKEMRRVLRPKGRLVVSVWRSVEHCPGHHALAQAMARHVNQSSGNLPQFSLADAGELRDLVTAAGFDDLALHSAVKISRYPSPERFVEWLMTGASIVTRRALAQIADEARSAFIDDVCTALMQYTDDEGLAVPMESHLLVAHS